MFLLIKLKIDSWAKFLISVRGIRNHNSPKRVQYKECLGVAALLEQKPKHVETIDLYFSDMTVVLRESVLDQTSISSYCSLFSPPPDYRQVWFEICELWGENAKMSRAESVSTSAWSHQLQLPLWAGGSAVGHCHDDITEGSAQRSATPSFWHPQFTLRNAITFCANVLTIINRNEIWSGMAQVAELSSFSPKVAGSTPNPCDHVDVLEQNTELPVALDACCS